MASYALLVIIQKTIKGREYFNCPSICSFFSPSKSMKHTDWLRLQTEGEKLCALLRQHHYQCSKQPHRLSWKINKDGKTYLLTWLPAPVGDWGLLPNDTTSARRTLWQLIQITIDLIAQFLGIPKSMILRAEPWAYIIFVHRRDKGGQFISYRKLKLSS